jgi:uncharacterized protein (DUF1800 family)
MIDPVDAFAHLATLGEQLVLGMIDAFWSFIALFTDGDPAMVDFAGRDLAAFTRPVASIGNAAAVPPDVVRLARQATFGPDANVINRIAQLGIPGWVEEQFLVRGSTYADLSAFVPANYCSANTSIPNCQITHLSRGRVAARFYANAMLAPDQLRQRVALALGQIMPTSINENNRAYGLAAYQQILLNNAFGNYRTLLGEVTMNGYMGSYLSMANSSKAAPSENYGRELLQLFTMGPVSLSRDGTPRLAANGATIPNYGEADVRAVSRALTGWTFDRSGDNTDWTAWDYAKPMIVRPGGWAYDGDAKTFLGTTVPAGATPEQSVAAVLDAAFNHPSTAARVSTLLIRHLVKSNPSPAYVERVTSAFENNGAGVRGDMKAILRAILLDPEARGDEPRSVGEGKLKEPILVMTSVARAIGLFSDGVAFVQRDTALGQPVFRAPSVFNFYSADYPLPRRTGLLSPASQLLSAGNVTASHNFVYDWTILGNEDRGDWNFDMGMPNFTGTRPIWSGWEAIGADTDRLVAVVNLLMLNNTATAAQKSALRNAAESIRDNSPARQARRRAQALLYIAASSPNFLVDR